QRDGRIGAISGFPGWRQAPNSLHCFRPLAPGPAHQQEKLRAGKTLYNSMLRTSVVPTIVRGGFRENVIPAEAEATLDVRALPDENMDELMATLRNLINMQTQVTRTARPPSDRS
ncbi:MAG: hypothetical protein DMG09_23370, partial [Acidobacteria bacterium]